MNILKARSKQEGDCNVYRCGVTRCPEVLGYMPKSGRHVDLTPGYDQNSAGVFIKTRHAGKRLKYNRGATIYGFTINPATMRIELGDKEYPFESGLDLGQFVKSLPPDEFKLQRRIAEEKIGAFVPKDDLPAIIRCARCGNLSKIEATD